MSKCMLDVIDAVGLGRIEPQFVITEYTTYDEIARFLNKDRKGVADLIYLLLKRRPDIRKEMKGWKFAK